MDNYRTLLECVDNDDKCDHCMNGTTTFYLKVKRSTEESNGQSEFRLPDV